MKKISVLLVCLLFLDSPGFLAACDGSLLSFERWRRPYLAPELAPVDFSNSPLLNQLLRGGNIYLSLSDAVTLGHPEQSRRGMERYTLPSANTEVLRAKGGGLLRGFPYNLAEVPVGVGGPASPLVTSVASSTFAAGSVPTNPSELGVLSSPQDNLSVQGTTPLSTGPAVPFFDPFLGAQVNWTHQTTPETNSDARERRALATNTTMVNIGYQQGFGPGTELNVSFNNSRADTQLFPTATYSPYTTSNFGFTVTQPLLRGFGLSVNRRFIRIAKNEGRSRIFCSDSSSSLPCTAWCGSTPIWWPCTKTSK